METELLAKKIFQKEKQYLKRGLKSDKNPTAFILGRQPASRKSNLATIIKREVFDKNFLVVNGDIYREFHPKYNTLNNFLISSRKKPNYFQMFSQRG